MDENNILTDEIKVIRKMLGEDSVVCIGSCEFQIFVQKNQRRIDLHFICSEFYPEIPPTVTFSTQDSTQLNDDIQECLQNITTYLRNIPFLEYCVQEVYRIISTQKNSSVSSIISIPNTNEVNKLLIDSLLLEDVRKQWITDHVAHIDQETRVPRNVRLAFLSYLLHKASKSKLSLQDCASIFSIQDIDSIEETVHKVLRSAPISITQQLDNSSDDTQIQVTGSQFFDEYYVINLISPGLVRARSITDHRDYSIRASFSEDDQNFSYSFENLTSIQHKYISRYSQYWIESFGPENAFAFSKTFGMSIPNSLIGSRFQIRFIKMEYCYGLPLIECFHLPKFFYNEAFIWKIMNQILEAVYVIHSKNFTNIYLSSENIFVDFGEGQIKIGDFSSFTKSPQFPYIDPDLLNSDKTNQNSDQSEQDIIHFSVSSKKNYLFAIGVLFFEMCHPFSSSEERSAILTKLWKTRHVPESWANIFPLQARVVELLLQPAENRPSAIEISRSKLIPVKSTQYSLKTILSAISYGSLNLMRSAPQVLDALFATSRRSTFRLQEFISNKNDPGKGNFDGRLTLAFFNLCACFGAKLFFSPIIGSYPQLPIMTNDDTMQGLRTSTSQNLIQWIEKNNISTGRFFSRNVVFSPSKNGNSIDENISLSFDIVGEPNIVESYVTCLQIVKGILKSVSENHSIKILVISSQLINSLDALGLLENMSAFYFNYNSSNINKLISRIESISLSDPSKAENSRIAKETLIFIRRIFDPLSNFFENSVISLNIKKNKIEIYKSSYPYIYLKTAKNSKLFAFIAPMLCKIANEIITLRMFGQELFNDSQNEIINQQNQSLIYIIPTTETLSNSPIELIKHPLIPPQEWTSLFVNAMKIAEAIRENGFTVDICKNDGKPVSIIMKEAFSSDIRNYIIFSNAKEQKTAIIHSRYINPSEIETILKTHVKDINIIR